MAIAPCGVVRAQLTDEAAVGPTRIVHRFDFDERDDGNMEDVPKFWEPLRPRGFPHYALGAFDTQVGRSAPPSFHLVSEARNVAYYYNGPETRVRGNTDYRIEGYIRPDRLKNGRACLSAHFLDKYGQPFPETLVRSRFVGGESENDGWVRVELYPPPAPPQAHTISLVAWVLQESVWSTGAPLRRHVFRADVRGGAWFDDITIYALPHVSMTTGVPGNVLPPDGPKVLHVVLADAEDATIEGRVSIHAADGALVETHTISAAIDADAGSHRISLEHLSPGLYQAWLDVVSGATTVVSRSLVFARLAPRYRDSTSNARAFGVVLRPTSRTDPTTELALLREQAARSVKLPVWSGLPDDPPTVQERRAADRLLHELAKSGFALTGVFFGPPSAIVRADGAYVRPLVELLNSDVSIWGEHLSAVVAPHASAFRWWQLGPDGVAQSAAEDQVVTAVTNVREAMRTYITMPRLSLTASTALEPPAQRLPVEQLALTLGSDVPSGEFAAQIERHRKLGYEHVSVYVQPLPEDQYGRTSRLEQWAQRIILARHAGAAEVFVPQTWNVRRTTFGRIAEPTASYIILRTIADVISDAAPGRIVPVARGVQCLAFDEETSTVLAMWDPSAPPEGHLIAVQLGSADRQIDVWGRSTPLARDDHGRQLVRVRALPILVPGVERWLIDFRTSFSLKPAHVESGRELVRHDIEMAYVGDEQVSGQMVLQAPESWQISPRSISFSLMPQRVGAYPLTVHYPHNEPAGRKEIIAKITLSRDRMYMEVPLLVDVGVADLSVRGMAVVAGTDLLLRHIVTNRSDDILSFRGSASVPGRERQYRPISNLQPGDTQTVDYRFSDGTGLIGRHARLVLREVNDGPRVHNLEVYIP